MIKLEDLSHIARAILDTKSAVEQMDASLKAKKEDLRRLEEETMPNAMLELGLTEIKLDTGEKVTIKQDVYAAIPAAGRGAAYGWLDSNGFGGLITTEITVPFSRGEIAEAKVLMVELQAKGLSASIEQGVHAQTLKAFLREQLAAGKDVPLDIFGARQVWTTKLK